MASPDTIGERRAQVWQALSQVVDPELDQSVTELGFISRCHVDGAGRVAVAYRLPTYWCAANFAFMMGQDMDEAVGRLPWLAGVRVDCATISTPRPSTAGWPTMLPSSRPAAARRPAI